MNTSLLAPAALRWSRLLSAVVGIILMATLVGACGKSSTTAASSAGGAAAGVSAASNTGAEPGTCPTSNTIKFAKTKFVAHAGLAFGAFSRYLYKPFKAGTFAKGAKGRIKGFIKAGLAALFIKREVRLAAKDVQANPTLCKAIAAPIRKFYGTITSLVSKVKGGDTKSIQDAQSSLTSVASSAKNQGTGIAPNENASIG